MYDLSKVLVKFFNTILELTLFDEFRSNNIFFFFWTTQENILYKY